MSHLAGWGGNKLSHNLCIYDVCIYIQTKCLVSLVLYRNFTRCRVTGLLLRMNTITFVLRPVADANVCVAGGYTTSAAAAAAAATQRRRVQGQSVVLVGVGRRRYGRGRPWVGPRRRRYALKVEGVAVWRGEQRLR